MEKRYSLTKLESIEAAFCFVFRGLWRKRKNTLQMLILVWIALSFFEAIDFFDSPSWHTAINGILLAFIKSVLVLLFPYFIMGIVNSILFMRQYSKEQIIRIEGHVLKIKQEQYVEIPCSDFLHVKETRHLLLLEGDCSGVLLFHMIPKRVFSAEYEKERFIRMLTVKGDSEITEVINNEYVADLMTQFQKDFFISTDTWIHYYTQIQWLSTLKIFKGKWRDRILKMGIILTSILIISLIIFQISLYELSIFAAVFMILGFIIPKITLKKSINEKKNKLLIGKQRLPDLSGDYEINIGDSGLHIKRKEYQNVFNWSYCKYLIQTQDMLAFFGTQGNSILVIPRNVFEEHEETDLIQYCKARNVEYIQVQVPDLRGGKKKTVSTMLIGIVIGAICTFAVFYCLIILSLYSAIADKPWKNKDTFIFIESDYPDYVPLEEQINILRSLGIDAITEEQIEEYKAWIEEDGWYKAYIEGTPYRWILNDIGYGDWDEETDEWTPSDTIYWFYLYGWDIIEDYIDILEGIQAISKNEFELTDINENCDAVDWEYGTGSILVSFSYNGYPYEYRAAVDYDWIDMSFLLFLSIIIEEDEQAKSLHFLDDEDEGILVFYNTEEWAKEFSEKTGLEFQKIQNQWIVRAQYLP